VAAALEESLAALPPRPADAATVALARRYAADIDNAEVVSLEATRVLERLDGGIDPVLFERLRGVVARIERTATLALLGPKYVAALEQLGLSPKGRADGKGVTGGTPPANGTSGELPGNGEPEDDLARVRRERASARFNLP
jgi:hypothetical protein